MLFQDIVDLAARPVISLLGNPATIFQAGNTGAWYDPSDLSTLFQNSNGTTAVTQAGDPVGYMADKSGNGNHAIQATAGMRPTLQGAAGGWYLQFDGVDDKLRVAFTFAQPITRVSAVMPVTGIANSARMFAGGNDEGGQFLWATGNILYISSNSLLQISGNPALDTAFVMTECHNGASSYGTINNGTKYSGDANTNAAGGISIGDYRVDFAPAKFRFYGALAIGRALTDSEIVHLRVWMAKKAGVTL